MDENSERLNKEHLSSETMSYLHQALRDDELRLVYQPQVDIVSGEIVGVEALLRWNHPTMGCLGPDRFLLLAEGTGLIGAISEWVIRHACADAVRWQRDGLSALRMTVNVSASELQQPHFSRRMLDLLEEAQLDPRCFGIELNEGFPMHRLIDISQQLELLRQRGIEIVLDDFGAGYSSLRCLRQLPIDVMKIDRSLLASISSGGKNALIARAIIAMAHSLEMKVLAVGVETEGQLEWLIANRCDRIQGYHFCAPAPSADIESMLRTGRRLSMVERRRSALMKRVLLVDDESWVLDKITQQLHWRFHETVLVESTCNPREALQRIGDSRYDVVVSDLQMPHIDGIAFLRQARRLQPDAVCMMLLGPSDLKCVINDDRQVEVFRYLGKPWRLNQLLSHFSAAFNRVSRQRARDVQSEAQKELRRMECQEPGITAVDRGPLDEMSLPSQLMTLPGDLWVKDGGSGVE